MHYGEGGSIPLVAAFHEALPAVLWGPRSRSARSTAPTSANSSAALLAEALFIDGLPTRRRPRRDPVAAADVPLRQPPVLTPPRRILFVRSQERTAGTAERCPSALRSAVLAGKRCRTPPLRGFPLTRVGGGSADRPGPGGQVPHRSRGEVAERLMPAGSKTVNPRRVGGSNSPDLLRVPAPPPPARRHGTLALAVQRFAIKIARYFSCVLHDTSSTSQVVARDLAA